MRNSVCGAAAGVCGSVLAQLALRLNWPQLSQFNHPAAIKQSSFQRRLSGFIASNPSNNAVLPNPSLKRSANGRPPGPGLGYAVHFPSPGPGVLPLSPA